MRSTSGTTAQGRETPSSPSDTRMKFFSEAECHAIADRIGKMATGGGTTVVSIRSDWTGNVRWARNQVTNSGEVLSNVIAVGRSVNGAGSRMVWVNDIDDATLLGAVRRAERLAAIGAEAPHSDLATQRSLEAPSAPALFSQSTYDLTAEQRAQAARDLANVAVEAGMLSAGYLEISAHSQALIDTYGRSRYFQYTAAQYSVTVRDPGRSGSGWAGVDWYDWAKIDGPGLSKVAVQKCLDSRNPVRLEPGRYTTILEPQAVGDLVSQMMWWMDRQMNEGNPPGPFTKSQDPVTGLVHTQLGDKVIDERITISSDPLDADAGFPPFDVGFGVDGTGDPFTIPVFHKTTWIDRGVLTNLSYDRDYAIGKLGQATGRPMDGGFRMTGGTTSMEEMIATTQRGLLVTRFDRVSLMDPRTQLCNGYTRDGLWLIENGKITKPAKNFGFTESVLFILNKVEQLGVPKRIYHPGVFAASIPAPIVVPPLKVSDFSFTSLVDAV